MTLVKIPIIWQRRDWLKTRTEKPRYAFTRKYIHTQTHSCTRIVTSCLGYDNFLFGRVWWCSNTSIRCRMKWCRCMWEVKLIVDHLLFHSVHLVFSCFHPSDRTFIAHLVQLPLCLFFHSPNVIHGQINPAVQPTKQLPVEVRE